MMLPNDIIKVSYQMLVPAPLVDLPPFEERWYGAQVKSLVCNTALREGHTLAGEPTYRTMRVVWVGDRKTGFYANEDIARECGVIPDGENTMLAFLAEIVCHQFGRNNGKAG